MSSLLNVSNVSKSEEFNLKGIEVLVDSKVRNWFKRAHVGKFLRLLHIHLSTARLADEVRKLGPFCKMKVGVTM